MFLFSHLGFWSGEEVSQGGNHRLGLSQLQHHEGMPQNGTCEPQGGDKAPSTVVVVQSQKGHLFCMCYHTFTFSLSSLSAENTSSFTHALINLWPLSLCVPHRTPQCRTVSLWDEECFFCSSSTAACCPLCHWARACCSSTCHVSSTGVAACLCVHACPMCRHTYHT